MGDALAEVLAATSDGALHIPESAAVLASGRGSLREWPWSHDTPAEAVEALHAAGLWPWPPGDESAPAWWCEVCENMERRRHGEDVPFPTSRVPPWLECDGVGTSTPPSHAALVSVAALSGRGRGGEACSGATALLTAAEIAREIAKHAGCEGARVVWRVMTRREIEEWAERGEGRPIGVKPVTIAQASAMLAWHGADEAPQWSRLSDEIQGASPALRDLAALNVHPIALDARRIVLAVERIGGDRG